MFLIRFQLHDKKKRERKKKDEHRRRDDNGDGRLLNFGRKYSFTVLNMNYLCLFAVENLAVPLSQNFECKHYKY